MDNGSGDYGKWTTEKYDFKEFKKIMIKWQEELAGKAFKLAKAMILAKKMVNKLTKVLDCDGYNIVQNNEECAGQSVFHFHMHLIPRYKGDQVGLGWKMGELSEEDKKEILDKMK